MRVRSAQIGALLMVCTGCQGTIGYVGDPEDPTLPQTIPPTCNESVVGHEDLPRLSEREYRNTLADLLTLVHPDLSSEPAITSALATLPSDVYEGQETTILVRRDHIQAYFDVALATARTIVGNVDYLAGIPGSEGCLSDEAPDEECLRRSLATFGTRVLRRPLSSAEIDGYVSDYIEGYVDEDLLPTLETTREKLTALFAILLQSPDFSYRIHDAGENIDGDPELFALTQYEIASKISYLIYGSMPDEELYERVARGELATDEDIREEAARMLGQPAARAEVVRFFREWLGYTHHTEPLRYDDEFRDGIELAGLQDAMTREVDELVQHLVFEENATYADLMTTDSAFVYDDNLAAVYGIENPSGRTTLPQQDRQGILSRAAFLTRRSGTEQSPILRGIFVFEAMLCREPGSPPADAENTEVEVDPNEVLSIRQRVVRLTEQPTQTCVNCHSAFNPLGFAYESFDSLGRHRDIEMIYDPEGLVIGEAPVDTSGEASALGTSAMFDGAAELHQQIASNERAMECMASHYFEHLQRRNIGADDGCHVESMAEALHPENGGSILSMIEAATVAQQFRQRRILSTDE